MGCCLSCCFRDEAVETEPPQELTPKHKSDVGDVICSTVGLELNVGNEIDLFQNNRLRNENVLTLLKFKRDVIQTNSEIVLQVPKDLVLLKNRCRYVGPNSKSEKESIRASGHEPLLIDYFTLFGWQFETGYQRANFTDLKLKSEEGKAVINLFLQRFVGNKLQIFNISRIENPFLYAMYLLKKEEMKSRNNGHVDELNLFHGTKKANVAAICNNNFDWRKYGENVGCRFGMGISFTPKPSYALHYCDSGPTVVMILAKVLVSKAVIGTKNMSIPVDFFNGKPRFYDTSVKENIDVIVKYGDNEFYPAYKIFCNRMNANSRPYRR